MDDLYNQLNGTDDSSNSNQRKNDTNIVSEEFLTLNLKQIVGIDHTNQQQVTANAESVTKLFNNYEEVVTASSRILEFVPDFNKTPHEKFWMEEVIPVIIECISQNDTIKSIAIKSFGIVQQLALTIKNAGEMVQQWQGSPEIVELAQYDIRADLKDLEQCIADVRNVKANAVYVLKDNMEKIFNIIGSEAAADFVHTKVKINNAMDCLEDELEHKSNEIALKIGEIEQINSLMLANEKLLDDEEQKDVADFTNLLLCLGSPRVRIMEEMIEHDLNYCESMILALNMRELFDEQQEATIQIFKMLTKELAELKKNYEIVKSELGHLLLAYDEQKQRIEKDIAIEREKLAQLDKSEKSVTAKIGHHGDALVRCLVSIEQFGEKIAKDTGGSVIQPLISMLEGIKAMVAMEVKVLQSNDPKNVFLAGSRLLRKVNVLELLADTGSQAVQKLYDKQLNRWPLHE